MSYAPINNSSFPENIELGHQRSTGARYSPPTGQPPPPPNPIIIDDDPTTGQKPKFHSHVTSAFGTKNEKWPDRSQRVASFTPLRGFILIWDVLFAAFPLAFIVLAILVARQNRAQQDSEYLKGLKQALLLSPTIFPILFAALMGRCFRQIGLYRAETTRGIELGRLEMLVGAQSLFSSLERQFSVSAWSVVGLLMTLIWLLSPLGGQSALRLFEGEEDWRYGNATFRYLNPWASTDTVLQGPSGLGSSRPTYTAIFLATLISATRFQVTSTDLWGNTRIPLFRAVEGDPDAEGWKMLPGGRHPGDGQGLPLGQFRDYATPKSDLTYASLIGIPIILPDNQTDESSFSIKTRLWDVTCSKTEKVPKKKSLEEGTWTLNWTNYNDKCYGGYPCKINMLSSVQSTQVLVASECEFKYDYYEVELWCHNTNQCEAARIRTLPLLDDLYHRGLDNVTRNQRMEALMITLSSLENTRGRVPLQSTITERWLYDPKNVIRTTGTGFVDLSELEPELLGNRLTAIWNTFWQSTYATQALGGNLPKNLTELTVINPFFTFNETLGATAQKHDISVVNWKWLVALLVCAIVLQIAAIVGLVLKYLSLAPDIVGYASSLTLMNPYIRVPTGGTTLHGLERAALLSGLRVRIGDVCPDEPVGAIALAEADDGRVGRLNRKRLYV